MVMEVPVPCPGSQPGTGGKYRTECACKSDHPSMARDAPLRQNRPGEEIVLRKAHVAMAVAGSRTRLRRAAGPSCHRSGRQAKNRQQKGMAKTRQCGPACDASFAPGRVRCVRESDRGRPLRTRGGRTPPGDGGHILAPMAPGHIPSRRPFLWRSNRSSGHAGSVARCVAALPGHLGTHLAFLAGKATDLLASMVRFNRRL